MDAPIFARHPPPPETAGERDRQRQHVRRLPADGLEPQACQSIE